MTQPEYFQVRTTNMWSIAAPIIAVLVAVPLSVAAVTYTLRNTAAVQALSPTPSQGIGYSPVANTTSMQSSGQDDGSCTPMAPSQSNEQASWGGSGSSMMHTASAPMHHQSYGWNKWSGNEWKPAPANHTTTSTWNTTTNNTYNKSKSYVVDSYNGSYNQKTNNWTKNNTTTVTDSFNKGSYNQKTDDSYNTVASNNKDESQTWNSASNGSTVNAPTNTSSNVAVGDGNDQGSSATSVNVSSSNQEDNSVSNKTEDSYNQKTEGSYNSKHETNVEDSFNKKNEWSISTPYANKYHGNMPAVRS